MRISLTKTLSGTFNLSFPSDYEKLKKIKVGEIYEYEYKQVRNSKCNAKFHVLINLVFNNQERYDDIETLRHQLTIYAGYYNLNYTLDGEEYKTAKSISFAKMSEEEFNDLYDKVIKVIVQYFHFDKEEILNEIAQNF